MATMAVEVSERFDTSLSNLILEMMDAGYWCRGPDDEVEKLDAEIVGGLRCRACGADKGSLHYEPFYKVTGLVRSYRPFTVCKECGNVREF